MFYVALEKKKKHKISIWNEVVNIIVVGNMFIEYATTLDYMKMKSTTERKGSEHSSLKCRVFKEAVENHERERARERGKVRGKEIERENKREENDRQMVFV